MRDGVAVLNIIKKTKFEYLILFILSIVILFYQIQLPLWMSDEGIVAYGAERVLAGDLPYRDFWTMYSPMQFYFVAFLYTIFGTSVLTIRLYTLAVEVISAMLIYHFCLKTSASRILAFTVWFSSLLWLNYGNVPGYNAGIAVLLQLLAIFVLFRFADYFHQNNTRSARKWIITAGILQGITALFRHDFGLYIVTSSVIALSVTIGFNLLGRPNPAYRLHALFKYLSYLLLGFCVVVFPVIIWLFLKIPVQDLKECFYEFPLKIHPSVRGIPYPLMIPGGVRSLLSLDLSVLVGIIRNLPYYLPLFAAAFGICATIFIRITSRTKLLGKNLFLVLLTSLVTLFLFIQAYFRADPIHLFPMIIISFILIPLLYKLFSFENTLKKGVLPISISIFIIVLLSVAPAAKYMAIMRIISHRSINYSSASRIDRARYQMIDEQTVEMIQTVIREVPENEHIYVGNINHDRVFTSDVIIYFLTERHSCTKYSTLMPGVITTLDVQKQVVEDLHEDSVNCIILSLEEQFFESNMSSVSSGVTYLDSVIFEEYEECYRFGDRYILLESRFPRAVFLKQTTGLKSSDFPTYQR